MKVSVLNYGMGNIRSVEKQVQRLGHQCVVIQTPKEVINADRLIIPGVGHAGKALDVLNSTGLSDALSEVALVKKIPVLGICLGMQIMCNFCEEGATQGLNWFDATVSLISPEDNRIFKVPHIGWNSIRNDKSHIVLEGLTQISEFYFVHSYYVKDIVEEFRLCSTTYDVDFVSGIFMENIIGVQFHPEKSLKDGDTLMSNFVRL